MPVNTALALNKQLSSAILNNYYNP